MPNMRPDSKIDHLRSKSLCSLRSAYPSGILLASTFGDDTFFQGGTTWIAFAYLFCEFSYVFSIQSYTFLSCTLTG